MWRGVAGFIPGILYVTNYRLCFSSFITKLRVVLSFRNIESLTKDLIMAFPNAIKCVSANETFIFGPFVNRDSLYEKLSLLWEMSSNEILDREEIEAELKSRQRYMEEHDTIPPPRKYTRPLFSNFDDVGTLVAKKNLINIFRFSEDETIQTVIKCTFREQKADIVSRGTLYCTNNFMAFISSNTPLLKVIIPYFDITSIQYVDKPSSFIVTTSGIVAEIFAEPKLVAITCDLCTALVKIKHSARRNIDPNLLLHCPVFERTHHLIAMIKNQEIKEIDDLESSNLSLEAEEKAVLLSWASHNFKYGSGYSQILATPLVNLVEAGIPNSKRGLMWQIFSGSIYKRVILEEKRYYQSLLQITEEKKDEYPYNIILDEIEKDLHRSFPDHPYFQTQEGLDALRNVLIACSTHNHEVGYCQAMNIVAALLLLYMDEESTFYLMTTICDILMPRCYSKSMSGSLIDQNIFEQLLRQRIPDLYSHLSDYNVPIRAIVVPWIMCLFIDCFPLDTVLRIFDMFFLFGVQAIYQVLLALFSLNKSNIMQEHDSYNITSLIKQESAFDADTIIKEIKAKFGDINLEISAFYRRYHTHKLSKKIRREWRDKILSHIDTTGYSKEELDLMYDHFIDVVKEEKKVQNTVDATSFTVFMRSRTWFRNLLPEEESQIFSNFAQEKESISFVNLISRLSDVECHGIEGKINLNFIVYKSEDPDDLSWEEVVNMIQFIQRIEGLENPFNPEAICQLIFDTSEKVDYKIQRGKVVQWVTKSNIFAETPK